MKHITPALLVFAAAILIAACGADNSPTGPFDGIDWDSVDTAADTAPTDTPADTSGEPGDDPPPTGRGTIEGIVYSPEPALGADPSLTKFPISGALVYITDTEPTPVPGGVYCNECIELPETIPNAFSGPDGRFEIRNVREGTHLMVVQKGEFRKVRYIDVVADTVTTAPEEPTTFPNSHYPDAGDTTPSIAIALGSYDDMEDIMAKIGLCDIDGSHHAILDTCDHIDFYDNEMGIGTGHPAFRTLLNDPTLMAQYQIIFVPCSNETTDMALRNAAVLTNIRNWVEAGGKWYIADWSYDFVEQVFPDFLDFEGSDSVIGDADDMSWDFDTTGRAVDTDLRDWLEQSILVSPDSISFEENWDCVQALGSVAGTDPDGTPITIVPDVYCEGPVTRDHECMTPDAPLTLTFPYGCGKVLFTTYHTVGAMGGTHPDLLTQEMILVYMILEIGLCTEPVIII